MTRTYYTLAIREEGFYAPQFGDYSRAVVEQELEDRVDSDRYRGRDAITRRDCKIIRTNGDQASINAAVKALNL